MVYYFTSNTVSPSAYVYVGKDKVENEDLIAYGVEEEVCSTSTISHPLISTSASPKPNHGNPYLKTSSLILLNSQKQTPSKARNKKDNVTIIYTPWSNLKKDGSMATGQVSFHDNKKVKKILVPTRINAIINRLNKTKVEKFPDFAAERDEIMKAKGKKNQAGVQARKKEEARIAKERRDLKYQKEHAYDDVFTEEALEASSNQNRDDDYLSDFM
ncbi:hypothetical protein GMDG_03355 [Pseudogymnoascus destructans 20631-21]|uniref:NFACT RNA-binding domain-containing protein n=1 Tax=Pseudogymnoascus destructans (strain ATCC MYA-4855 / 20631-21) TaxID=658429 RepID=L8G757_PSED2|nr:hypothetical protein GMDG_03355 [Pseudogymnoascus destructans 20631-21]